MLLTGSRPSAPDAPAIVDAMSGQTWSHATLRDELAQTAARLPNQKSLIVVLVRNDVPSLLAYLGALEGGHAVLPLGAAMDQELLTSLLAAYQPEVVVGPSDLALDDPGYRRRAWDPTDLAAWERTSGDAPALHPDLALLLSTSGSTGSPKLVRLSAGNVYSNADAIRVALAIGGDERACTSLPFSYSYGLSVVHSHVLAGACLVVTKHTLLERDFWRETRAHRCTSLAGVPYMFEMLRRIGFDRLDQPDLRTLTQAGGKLGNELIRQFHEWMVARHGRLVVMYGQTEATARIAVLPPELLPGKLGSVGFALPGGRIRIVGDNDRSALPPGTRGEVEYTGPNVMMGYGSTREDLSRGDELGGVLRTGDIGYLDHDGCLFVVGRRKRFAKVYGLRVSLDDVEAQLHPAGPVAVLDGGESILVCCTPSSADVMRQKMLELSAKLRVPAAGLVLRVIEHVPQLPSGKVDYQQVGALLGSP